MGYALHVGEKLEKESNSLQTLMNCRRKKRVRSVGKKEKEQRKFLCRKKETSSYFHVETFLYSGQGKVLKSDHPTEFGKIPIMEKRTNPILQNNNKNKMTLKQNTISGVPLGNFIYRHHVQE